MAVKFQDYYEILGVPRTASADEIKQAFRRLAREFHPDVAKNKEKGEARFKEINEAYEVLGDPEKRRRYDELGADWQRYGEAAPPPPRRRSTRRADPHRQPDFEFGGTTGFSDFFESFFGRGEFDEFRRRTQADDEYAQGTRGEDVEADLLVTLDEALKGGIRKVTVRRPDGHGEDQRQTYQVRIPAGVHEGQRIRLSGQGGEGVGAGESGDLYLRVRFARHPDFTVEGADLFTDLPVAPWEAVLGAQVRLPALDGATTLRIPPRTSAGSQLRLRGLGLPRKDGTRGDLFAVVKIRVPDTLSPEELKLWEQLAKSSPFNARDD